MGVSESAVKKAEIDLAILSGGGFGHIGINVSVSVEIGVIFVELLRVFDFSVNELGIILVNVGDNA